MAVRPGIRAFLSLHMFVLSVVSILEEILLDRGQGNLKLKPRQREALQVIVF